MIDTEKDDKRNDYVCDSMIEGEVPEWSIGPHSKCGVRATVPGVRIPPSPPPLAEVSARSEDTKASTVDSINRNSMNSSASFGGQGPLVSVQWHVYILKCADDTYYDGRSSQHGRSHASTQYGAC